MEKKDLAGLVIKQVYSINTIYTDGDSTATRDFRPSWAILQKWEGATEYFTKSGERILSDYQNPVVLPYGSAYSWHCLKAGRYTIIEFEADGACDDVFSFPIQSGDWLYNHMRKLEQIHMLRKPFYEMETLEGAYHILLHLLHANTKNYVPSERLQKIQPAVDYIVQHYDRNITNEELSALTSVSTVYFRKIFTDVYGISPIHYLQNIRIQKAKEMLQSDYGSISNIALSLGYQNIYHFSKAFKKAVGVSPSAYMKSKQKDTPLSRDEKSGI